VAKSANRRLLTVKLVHTAVWAFFAACIVAIPVLSWMDELRAAAVLCGVVFVEVLVLAFNGWRCPLTPVAARYTDDRRANFDIFLPEWSPATTRRSSVRSMSPEPFYSCTAG
jgi:hypothetical protein